MICFFQKRFGDDLIKVVRVSLYWYILLGVIVMFIVRIIYGDGRPEYGEFFQSWRVACAGMILMIIAILEFGLTLVFIIGREKTVLNSIPLMLPQCVMLLGVILINVFALGNPSRFRQLSVDMTRVRQNDPVEEEIARFSVVSVIHSDGFIVRGRGRTETKYDYYLEFGEKRAKLSKRMYLSLYEMIGGKGDVGYRRSSPPGTYLIRYLPNSMIVLDVSEVESKKRFP